MNFIELAGIRHGSETDLESILSRREQIMQAFREACRSCVEHGTSMPVNLVKSGNVMLEKPESTRALMSFLRACDARSALRASEPRTLTLRASLREI